MHLRRSFRSTKRLTVRVLTWSAWAASPTVQNCLSIAGRSSELPLQAVPCCGILSETVSVDAMDSDGFASLSVKF